MKLYKINEVRSIQHYQVPKVLFKHPFYEELTNDTRLAYSILLDRLELSRQNNWVNENDEVYIIYTRGEMGKELNVGSKTTITKIFKQLNDFELIREERLGLNKPNRIYVAHLKPLPLESERGKKTVKVVANTGSTESVLQEVQEDNNGSTENGLQDIQKINTNNTNLIKTNKIDYKIDRFNLLFNSSKDNVAGAFEKNDDTKGIVIAEYLLTNPTDRSPEDIGLTTEQEAEYLNYLEKAELLIEPDHYDYFFTEANKKLRQYSYLMFGVIYDLLKSPHKRYLSSISRELILEVLNRVDMYQEDVADIYAYFKKSLLGELKK